MHCMYSSTKHVTINRRSCCKSVPPTASWIVGATAIMCTPLDLQHRRSCRRSLPHSHLPNTITTLYIYLFHHNGKRKYLTGVPCSMHIKYASLRNRSSNDIFGLSSSVWLDRVETGEQIESCVDQSDGLRK